MILIRRGKNQPCTLRVTNTYSSVDKSSEYGTFGGNKEEDREGKKERGKDGDGVVEIIKCWCRGGGVHFALGGLTT